jgi:hypothetical protein
MSTVPTTLKLRPYKVHLKLAATAFCGTPAELLDVVGSDAFGDAWNDGEIVAFRARKTRRPRITPEATCFTFEMDLLYPGSAAEVAVVLEGTDAFDVHVEPLPTVRKTDG